MEIRALGSGWEGAVRAKQGFDGAALSVEGCFYGFFKVGNVLPCHQSLRKARKIHEISSLRALWAGWFWRLSDIISRGPCVGTAKMLTYAKEMDYNLHSVY